MKFKMYIISVVLILIIVFTGFLSQVYSIDYSIEKIENNEILQDYLYLDSGIIKKYNLKAEDHITIYFYKYDDNIIHIKKR